MRHLMLRIGQLSAEIREVINGRPGVFDDLVKNKDGWNRLTSAMDLLDDSALALLEFEEKGFGRALSGEVYLRFYGTLQAIVLQQEAIQTIFELIVEAGLDSKGLPAWSSLRDFRNRASGHPLDRRSGSPGGKLRTFVARAFMSPSEVLVISFEEKTGAQLSERYPLRTQYDDYKLEAVRILNQIRETQDSRWPANAA